MTEERAPYRRTPRDRDGLQPIGEILRQFVDAQGWDPHLLPARPPEHQPATSTNGKRRDG